MYDMDTHLFSPMHMSRRPWSQLIQPFVSHMMYDKGRDVEPCNDLSSSYCKLEWLASVITF